MENCCVSSVSKSCGYVVSVEDAAYVVVEGVGDKGEVECEWGRTSLLLRCAFRFLRLLFVDPGVGYPLRCSLFCVFVSETCLLSVEEQSVARRSSFRIRFFLVAVGWCDR